MPAQIDMDTPEGYDFSLGTRDENALSGKALENPRPPILGEAMRPLQVCVQPVLGGTLGQSSRVKVRKEKRWPPSVPMLSTASLGPPNSLALDLVGTQASAVLSETSDSDLTLTVLASHHQNQRRAPLMEKPRRRTKAKGKAKADSVDVDASREDIGLGG